MPLESLIIVSRRLRVRVELENMVHLFSTSLNYPQAHIPRCSARSHLQIYSFLFTLFTPV